MQAECNIVYSKSAGTSSMSWSNKPANYVRVIVRQWMEGFLTDYVLDLRIEENGEEHSKKEIIDGDLDKAVRRGIAVFDEELAKHPVLGQQK